MLLSDLNLPNTRIIHQDNRGLAAARNAGIRQAQGKYICCLDADDRLRPGYFAAAVPILEQEPGTGMVTGLLQMFDENSGIFYYHEFDFPDLLADNRVIVPALFRRAAWEQVGGYCETFSSPGVEDWDFWISLYEAGYQAHLLDEVLYDYRIRTDAMSAAMYQPQIWKQLSLELVNRHWDSYQKHFAAVVESLNIRWVQMRNWTRSVERSQAWWERQSGIWQYAAENKDREILRLEAWIRELETRITQFEQQIAQFDSQPESGAESDKDLLSHISEVEKHEWINPTRPGFLGKVWYGLGKRLGLILADSDEKGGQYD